MIVLCLPDLRDLLEVPDRLMIAPCLADLYGGVILDAACFQRCFWSSLGVVSAEVVSDAGVTVPWHRDTQGRGERFRRVLRQVEVLFVDVV